MISIRHASQLAGLFSATLSIVLPSRPWAATLPSGFTETKLIGSVNPTCVDETQDGRILLCEKSGFIRVYKNNKWLTAPLLTVDADYQEERGLLGLALDPDFQNNPFVYIYYTAKAPVAHNRVSRFRVNGDVTTGAEQVLLDLNNLGALRSGGWHNGGSIHFGKDGKLYITTGNNTIQAYSQSLDNLLGKVLRINPDGSIPTDNPFNNTATGNNKAIWALGLRNPYTSDIHPVSGRMLVNDVGDGSFEEINDGKSGANYGYPKAEGHANIAPAVTFGTYSDPVSNYGHGNGCAIAGGSFYHPAFNAFGAEYADVYFFSDYCGGWIKSMNPAGGNAVKAFATNIPRPIYLKGASDGSLYYVCRGARASGLDAGGAADNQSTGDGSLYRIKGPVPNPVSASRRRSERVPMFISQVRILLPQGMSRLSLYDLSGSKVWEYQGSATATSTWLDLPSTLSKGAFHVRFK